MTGPAGSITIHNCRTVHGSKKNLSTKGRPLLLNIYSAADAFPYTANPLNSPQYSGVIVWGKEARWAYHDPRPCLIPPDWSGGLRLCTRCSRKRSGRYKVLITMLPDDDTFWQEASEETLKQIWDNKEDDVYARLLDE